MSDAAAVRAKRDRLQDLLRHIRPGAMADLDHSQKIDITYASNAIEGNTLTAGETALVLEKGMTIAGKPLKDHLEAIDHAAALDWVMDIASGEDRPITEADIRNLHRLTLAKSRPEIAGSYADAVRLVNTAAGPFRFPAPAEIPALMRDFAAWLQTTPYAPQTAFDAHRKLVAIHPFNDGNGRTARLLMNLVLLRDGYPAIAVRPEDRPAYIAALEMEQAGGGHRDFDALMFARLDKTLDLYLESANQLFPKNAAG